MSPQRGGVSNVLGTESQVGALGTLRSLDIIEGLGKAPGTSLGFLSGLKLCRSCVCCLCKIICMPVLL